MPVDAVHACLEALYAATDGPSRVVRDPLRFVHRYTDPLDQEVAGLVAVVLAFGSVDLFLPVLDEVFERIDASGGPKAASALPVERLDALLDGIRYRWNDGRDLALLLSATHRAAPHTSLSPLFAGPGDLALRLTRATDTLRDGLVAGAQELGLPVLSFADLPRGARYLLPSPRDGSGCKRWLLYLRWMVRPPTEGVDRGLWSTLTPADLQMPVDVHVARLSRFLGLTTRADASWRTSREITDRLRGYDAEDPVRYDFALAHTGISGDCKGHRDVEVCPGCVLNPVCRAPDTTSSRRGP